jgi:hypothetical protein
VTTALAGAVLLIMGAFTPWALLRLLPLAEVASSAAGSLARETRGRAHAGADMADLVAHSAPDWAAMATARMRSDASGATPLPPAANEASVVDATPAPPQGGEGVAARDAEQAPQASDGDDDEVRFNRSDIGVEEMHKDEHRGKFRQ